MKKIFLLSIAIYILPFTIQGQCKFKSSGPVFTLLNKHSDVAAKSITKPRIIFDKFSVAASQFFIKSNDEKDYFGFSFFRSYSAKFEVLSDSPLIMNLEGGQSVKLLPTTNYEGRRPGLSITHFQIIPVYTINKEQIELLVNNKISNIRFYLVSEADIANTEVDEIGRYFDFEINSDKFKNNLQSSADCFLHKNK